MRQGRGAEWEENQSGWSGEALVLCGFGRRIGRGFGDHIVVFENLDALSENTE